MPRHAPPELRLPSLLAGIALYHDEPRTQACAVPVAFGKRASAEFLHMSSALAYEGRLYVLAGTLGSPYRAFSTTRMETVPQPGDYVVPEPQPSPDSDPGEG